MCGSVAFMPKGKVNPFIVSSGKVDQFALLAEKLIREAEALPVSLDAFVEGLEQIAELISERAALSRTELRKESEQ